MRPELDRLLRHWQKLYPLATRAQLMGTFLGLSKKLQKRALKSLANLDEQGQESIGFKG
jgi:hypothetical protein